MSDEFSNPIKLQDMESAPTSRLAALTTNELIDIRHAAWIEDQEYGMSDSLRALLPEIEATLNARGYELRGGGWYAKVLPA